MSNSQVPSSPGLEDTLLPVHSPGQKPNPLLSMTPLTALLHPRKSRQRTTLFALILFSFITIYVFLLYCTDVGSSLAIRRSEARLAHTQLSVALDSIRHSESPAKPLAKPHSAPQIQLSNAQELAAISSFLSSLPQNQIPSFVDPTQPIDPELILDFDTRSPRALQEVQVLVEDVWSKNPVFLYSKHYSPASREVKAILNRYRLRPSPTIIDVDLRDDADVLAPSLSRLISGNDLPVLIVAGKIVGTVEDVRRADADGTLRRMIAQSGAIINGARRHRKH